MQKRFFLGTHRSARPEQTLDSIKDIIAGVGIVRVANLTGLDRLGVPVYTAIRPRSRSNSASFGKGVSPAASLVGALMESIENHFAEAVYFEHTLRDGSANDVPGTDLLTATACRIAVEDVHTVFDPRLAEQKKNFR